MKELRCSQSCYRIGVDTSEGTFYRVEHAIDCPISIHIYNTKVNTRQVRRARERKEAKKNGA
jgi:hypothetical protein